MLWDTLVGLALVASAYVLGKLIQRVGELEKEVEALTAMVRVFRHRALVQERDDGDREAKK